MDARPFWRYAAVLMVSLVLHGVVWQLRGLLNFKAESEAKPLQALEVMLTAAPNPVATAPSPAAPAALPVTKAAPPPPKPKPKPAIKPKPVTPRPEPEPEPPVRKQDSAPAKSQSEDAPPGRSHEATSSTARTETRTEATSSNNANSFESAKANAAYLHNPRPVYPEVARRREWEGRVLLKVQVLANGHAATVTLATSSGHDVLDEAALEAVRNWHFVPAKRGGQPVDSWVTVPINFNLQ